jgi:hypothetical protein
MNKRELHRMIRLEGDSTSRLAMPVQIRYLEVCASRLRSNTSLEINQTAINGELTRIAEVVDALRRLNSEM